MKGSADVDDARRDKRAVVPQTADAALLEVNDLLLGYLLWRSASAAE